jgi:hypothetical protein
MGVSTWGNALIKVGPPILYTHGFVPSYAGLRISIQFNSFIFLHEDLQGSVICYSKDKVFNMFKLECEKKLAFHIVDYAATALLLKLRII